MKVISDDEIYHSMDGKVDATQSEASRAAEYLRALANPHRLMILWLLHERKYTVMEICEELQLRQSLVSQHLARLRLDGVVNTERQGHYVIYSLQDEKARDILKILTPFVGNAARTPEVS